MKSITLIWILTSFALATASPLDKRAITAQELSNFRLFIQYAAAAACNNENTPGQAVTCSNNICPLVEENNAITSLGFVSPVLDMRGFIAIDPARSLIVVAFRGTSSVQNVIADILFLQIPCPLATGCLVHLGFAGAWAEVSSTVISGVAAAKAANPGYAVVVTGHSLGGAVATLAAAYLRVAGHPADLYTYGSPRVGNRAFVDFLTTQAGAEYRVTHTDDPVPKLPPIVVNYRHTSPEYWITTDDSDVSAAQVTVCTGYSTVDCNAGTTTTNGTAHIYYFSLLAGCGPDDPPPQRRQVLGEPGDVELETRLRLYSEMDIQAVTNMRASGETV